jgi:hypothetical protein
MNGHQHQHQNQNQNPNPPHPSSQHSMSPPSQSPPLPNLHQLSISPYNAGPPNDYRYNGVFGPPGPGNGGGNQGWTNNSKRSSRSGLPSVSICAVCGWTGLTFRTGTSRHRENRPTPILMHSVETHLHHLPYHLHHQQHPHPQQAHQIHTAASTHILTTRLTHPWPSLPLHLRSCHMEWSRLDKMYNSARMECRSTVDNL